jgi:DNA-binding transcriptional MerR regulator
MAKEEQMDWSIHDIARMTGITSRTLRHYHRIGLLEPSRIGSNGYRFYDEAALVRLQRILLLRDLGLGLATIAEVLAREIDTVVALRAHLQWLRAERERMGDRIGALESTIAALERKEPLMAETMFKGFDHSQYKDEVIERWGQDAWKTSNDWWTSLTAEEKDAFQREQGEIVLAYMDAHAAGLDPASDEAQAITDRHYRWMSHGAWKPNRETFTCIGQMYVDDPRFTAVYERDGRGDARYVADAMRIYAERNLT